MEAVLTLAEHARRLGPDLPEPRVVGAEAALRRRQPADVLQFTWRPPPAGMTAQQARRMELQEGEAPFELAVGRERGSRDAELLA